MAKKSSRFVCQSCGQAYTRWMGRCAGCGQWNTLVQETAVTEQRHHNRSWASSLASDRAPQSITSLDGHGGEEVFSTGLAELDRVLGGGIVPGSLGLVGGDPGIGKSTLLLQAAAAVAKATGPVLYISGEESLPQLHRRAQRLQALTDDLSAAAEADVEVICRYAAERKPALVLIDSIQTVFTDEVSSPPGSVAQVRECAARFLQLAKGQGVAVVLVGHVTKGGSIAGPKVLEHAVDYVLYFEGEQSSRFRILRGVKNRFGSTNEIGIFDMTEQGLVTVDNPSQFFLDQRPVGSSGTVVVPCMEGTRPLLVEVQALVADTPFEGTPRRQATGVDYHRFSIILAVLEKRLRIPLYNKDVYVNAAGGLKLSEPGADLAVAAAVASSFRGDAIAGHTAVVGEVGLTGELRAVHSMDQRLQELQKLGFQRCVVPRAASDGRGSITVQGAATVAEAMAAIFSDAGR